MSQMVSMQSLAANAATNLQAGQDIVVNALQSRFNSTSAVNIDTEMANLLTLQNSYGANARVMSTVKQMLDALLQIDVRTVMSDFRRFTECCSAHSVGARTSTSSSTTLQQQLGSGTKGEHLCRPRLAKRNCRFA